MGKYKYRVYLYQLYREIDSRYRTKPLLVANFKTKEAAFKAAQDLYNSYINNALDYDISVGQYKEGAPVTEIKVYQTYR